MKFRIPPPTPKEFYCKHKRKIAPPLTVSNNNWPLFSEAGLEPAVDYY